MMINIDFKSYHDLFSEIKKINPKIIAIDGNKGSGKTNLSYKIGFELIKNVINIDDYLTPNEQGDFVKAINFPRLEQRIKNIQKYDNLLIIEGVCLLEILERVKVNPDCFIYCKEIDQNTRLWYAGDYLDETDRVIFEERLKFLSGLDIELAEYHYKYRPFEKANIIYNIIKQLKS